MAEEEADDTDMLSDMGLESARSSKGNQQSIRSAGSNGTSTQVTDSSSSTSSAGTKQQATMDMFCMNDENKEKRQKKLDK